MTLLHKNGRVVWNAARQIRPYVSQCKTCIHSTQDPVDKQKWYVCEGYEDLPFWTMPESDTFIRAGVKITVVDCQLWIWSRRNE